MLLEEMGEEGLREVPCLLNPVAPAAYEDVERLPVGLAQSSQRLTRERVKVAGDVGDDGGHATRVP